MTKRPLKSLPSQGDTVRFINIGTLDRLRAFDVVLDAFENMAFSNWHLDIVVSDKEYIRTLLTRYPTLKVKITLHEGIHTLDELRATVKKNDIGIALLPSNHFYNTVIANKIIHYASCGLPALMINNEKNHSIFSEDQAYFSDFDVDSITASLTKMMHTPKEKLAQTGKQAQDKLLHIRRNYKVLAKELSDIMDDIVVL